jgi:hypothetical protein
MLNNLSKSDKIILLLSTVVIISVAISFLNCHTIWPQIALSHQSYDSNIDSDIDDKTETFKVNLLDTHKAFKNKLSISLLEAGYVGNPAEYRIKTRSLFIGRGNTPVECELILGKNCVVDDGQNVYILQVLTGDKYYAEIQITKEKAMK